MKKYILSLAIIALVFSFACNESVSQGKSKLIDVNAFAKKIKSDKSAVILDMRTDQEVKEGMIEGAAQLDFYGDGFYDMIQELDKSKTYYIYCKSGNRSGKAAAEMKKMGLNTVDMEGGIISWKANGKALVNKKTK